jgi:uncharacterized membrane protein YtjA (UPF0391 family)
MFRWARIFLVIAIIAAIFGFVGGTSATTEIPRICFFVALTLSAASLITGLTLHRPEFEPEFEPDFEPELKMGLN